MRAGRKASGTEEPIFMMTIPRVPINPVITGVDWSPIFSMGQPCYLPKARLQFTAKGRKWRRCALRTDREPFTEEMNVCNLRQRTQHAGNPQHQVR